MRRTWTRTSCTATATAVAMIRRRRRTTAALITIGPKEGGGDLSLLILPRYRSFSSSSSSRPPYTDPALEWGRQNPKIAEQCLQIPPLSPPPPPLTATTERATSTATTASHLNSLEDYWEWRQWDFSSVTGEEEDYAKALVSHVLSAPLTLAKFYYNLQQQRQTTSNHHWCCVGARAEATLPLDFWKELLVAIAGIHHHTNSDLPIQLSIDFVGPEIHPPKSIPPQTLTYQDHHQLQLRWLYKGYLHDYIQEHQHNNSSSRSMPEWTGFVLLNPGLGHDHLKKGWEPTLEYLLSSAKTFKQGEANEHNNYQQQQRTPILLTAHSELDAQRDYQQLLQHMKKQKEEGNNNSSSSVSPPLQPPISNPFASRITYEDPFHHQKSQQHFVQPNHSYLMIL